MSETSAGLRKVSVTLHPHDYDRLRLIAKAEGTTPSYLLRQAIALWLTQRTIKQAAGRQRG